MRCFDLFENALALGVWRIEPSPILVSTSIQWYVFPNDISIVIGIEMLCDHFDISWIIFCLAISNSCNGKGNTVVRFVQVQPSIRSIVALYRIIVDCLI